jgi:multidrug efflux system membrane fusion protein
MLNQPIVWAWAALAALGTVGCSTSNGKGTATAAASGPPPGAPVRVARAETRNVPVEIAAVGNVEAYTTIVVKAQIGGALTKVHFEEGQMVRKGDPLFEIDARPYEEAIRQWEANLARENALLRQSEANLGRARSQEEHYGKQAQRYTKLAAEGIFSQEQADQAEVEARGRRTAVRAELANMDSIKAAIAADEAALANARLNLSYCSIASPITGRTGSIHVKQGNLVKANDVELVTIHQIQPVFVTFSIPEEHLTSVRRRVASGSLRVRASIPGDDREAPSGRLTFLDNAVDSSTGTIRLKANFANADSRLWPGQFVDVKLRLEDRPNAVVVPAAALQTGQRGNFVFVVKADQSVEMRAVTPGPRVESLVALNTGLTPGETVVTEGQLRLAPGVKVRVTP